MSTFGSGQRARHPRRSGADDGDLPRLLSILDHQFGFSAGTRIDQAVSQPPFENLVEARLIAGNAGIDLVGSSGCRLVDKSRVSEERSRH